MQYALRRKLKRDMWWPISSEPIRCCRHRINSALQRRKTASNHHNDNPISLHCYHYCHGHTTNMRVQVWKVVFNSDTTIQ